MKNRKRRNHNIIAQRRKLRVLKWVFLFFVFGGIYLAARVSMNWNVVNSDDTGRVGFVIESGQPFASIVASLVDNELVQDGFVFGLYAKNKNLDTKLQAGEYVLQRNLNYAELLEVLQNGKSEEMKITIPEGYTISQMDGLLAKMSLIEAGVFEDCARSCELSIPVDSLEGFLFPSTYYVNPKQFSAAGFLKRLYATFEQQIAGLQSDIENSGRTLGEIVIVASMIERETTRDEEMPIVSGIMWKRYDEGMHLGIDATTRYEKNDWKGPLYAVDFQSDSLYNTRRKIGLPPTAIANPGKKALEAAVNPEASEYYYYLHGNLGGIHYGKTLADHNANKAEYIQ